MIILGYYNKATYYRGTTPIKKTYAGNRIYVDDANPGTEDAIIFEPLPDCNYLYFTINSIDPNQTLYYSTNGKSWTQCKAGQKIKCYYTKTVGGGGSQNPGGGGIMVHYPQTIYLRGAVVNTGVTNSNVYTNITFGNESTSTQSLNIKGKLRGLIGTMSAECCKELFKGSAFIKDASALELPNTVRQSCYESMFENCTDLEIGPTLPATTLANSCYKNMFKGCTKLNHIVCNATDISATDCTTDWVNGVASAGLFERNENNNSWTIGVNGIPTNWTVQPPLGVPNDEIWYTSTDSNVVNPNAAYLNATIASNTYSGGKGIIKFETDLTEILDGSGEGSSGTPAQGAFANITNISSIKISNSVTSIGGWTFYGCSSLTSMTIPNSVTSIGDYAFYDCTSLTSVTIPNIIRFLSIGESAFENCRGLTSVTIPGSVASIGDYAFSGCSGLTSISYTGFIIQWNSITKGTDWNSGVPATVVHCTDGDVSI